MDVAAQIEEVWSNGRQAMIRGDYGEGAVHYKEAIRLLHELESQAPEGPPLESVRLNLANAYADLSQCLLRTCGVEFSEGVHAIMDAMLYGNREETLRVNLLYCMGIANKFMGAMMRFLPDSEQNRELVRWLNGGYALLKTHDPSQAGGRDWEAAARSYEEAIRLAPECAPAHYGLGLAYEGAKEDEKAIDAWLRVKQLEPDYNFECRCRFEIR